MPSASGHDPLTHFTPADPLFELQLLIARRADEFAHLCSKAGSAMRDREMWQQAEAECLRRAGLGLPSVSRPPSGNTLTPYPATLGRVA